MAGYLEKPLLVKQGDTLIISILVEDAEGNPVDLTGKEVCMQWRIRPTTEVKLQLSTSNGRIVVDENEIKLNVSAEVMQEVEARDYVFDLQTEADDIVQTLLSGKVRVVEDITYDC